MQLRDALAEKEDLQVQNSLLQKRLDKTKTSTTRGSFAKWQPVINVSTYLRQLAASGDLGIAAATVCLTPLCNAQKA